VKNDIWITHWLRDAENRMRELQEAVRTEPEWIVMQRASDAADALMNLRYRAIHLGFEKHPPVVNPPEV